MKLADVFDQYMIDAENRGRAEGTIVHYRYRLGLLLRWLEALGVVELEAVTLALLRQFLSYLISSDSSDRFPDAIRKGKLQASTVGVYVATIKAFFNWCVDEDLLTVSPAARLKKPKTPKKVRTTLTPEQLGQLLAACDTNTRSGFRNYVMLLLLLDTGMRVSELCSLSLSDVHPRYVKVHGKGQREREIGLHPDMSKLLWKYINKHRFLFGVQSDYVFVGERGPLTVSGVETIFDNLEKQAGIANVSITPHVMRHTFSKRYLKNGGDLFKLSRELGHSSIQITSETYLADFNSTDAREDHDRFSPLGDVKLGKVKDGKKGKRDK
jgi:integrase/recombinase XerD